MADTREPRDLVYEPVQSGTLARRDDVMPQGEIVPFPQAADPLALRDSTFLAAGTKPVSQKQDRILRRAANPTKEIDILPSGEVYMCVAPDTPVLQTDLSWKAIGDLRVGDDLLTVDEQAPAGQHRKMRPAQVEAVVTVKRDRLRIVFESGKEIVCGVDHPWLTARWRLSGSHQLAWVKANNLRPGYAIYYVGEPWRQDTSHEAGYLAGLFDGEGSLHKDRGLRKGGAGGQRGRYTVALSQNPGGVLDRARDILTRKGFDLSGPHPNGNNGCLCIRVNGLYQTLRLLGEIRPQRLLESADTLWRDKTVMPSDYQIVTRIEKLPAGELVDIQTGTGTFVGAGLVSHNSHVFVRRRLNDAYGPQGWALRPVSAPDVQSHANTMYREFALIAMGRVVATAIGSAKYYADNKRMDFGDTAEAVKSNALTRCSKDLGIGSECWDRQWCEDWKNDFTVHVYVQEKDKRDRTKTIVVDYWRRIDGKPFHGELEPVRDSPNQDHWRRQMTAWREMIERESAASKSVAKDLREARRAANASSDEKVTSSTQPTPARVEQHPPPDLKPARTQPGDRPSVVHAPSAVNTADKPFLIRACKIVRAEGGKYSLHAIEMMDGRTFFTFSKRVYEEMNKHWAARDKIIIKSHKEKAGTRVFDHVDQWQVRGSDEVRK